MFGTKERAQGEKARQKVKENKRANVLIGRCWGKGKCGLLGQGQFNDL